jgi:hypothetical protein
MWTVSVLGQSPRQLREGITGGWEVSPDGMRIAFGTSATFSTFRDVWVMGSGETTRKGLFFVYKNFLHVRAMLGARPAASRRSPGRRTS